jgi:D-3-phosphoglycerate dehydrogenase
MLGLLHQFIEPALKLGFELVAAPTTQTLSEEELIRVLPEYDGWIIGDDPATFQVFKAAKSGKLVAAVKWGIGVDNVDFAACEELDILITNTPNMFGTEVADLAICLMLGLARQSFFIDREIRQHNAWPKPAGMSITGKHIGIVGFGDTGYNTAKRLMGFDVKVTAYDPAINKKQSLEYVEHKLWPEGIHELDFLIFTCSLNQSNYHMLDAKILEQMKSGSFIVNVARGPLIDEEALTKALLSGHIAAAALDVFETEPLPENSRLRMMPQCILSSHNASNTVEAVHRASHQALQKMADFFSDLKKNE